MNNNDNTNTKYYSIGDNYYNCFMENFFNNENSSNFIISGNSNFGFNSIHILNYSEDLICNKVYEIKEKIIKSTVNNFKNSNNMYTLLNSIQNKTILSIEDIHNIDYTKIYEQNSELNNKNYYEIDTNYFDLKFNNQNIILLSEKNISNFDLEKLHSNTIFNDGNSFNCFELNSNKNSLLVGNSNNVNIYDSRSNKKDLSIINAHDNEIKSISLNPNRNEIFLTTSFENLIKIWDIRKPIIPINLIENHQKIINHALFNNSYDQLILYSSLDGSVSLYNLFTQSSSYFLNLDEEIDINNNDNITKKDGILFNCDCALNDTLNSISFSKTNNWLYSGVSYLGQFMLDIIPNKLRLEIML